MKTISFEEGSNIKLQLHELVNSKTVEMEKSFFGQEMLIFLSILYRSRNRTANKFFYGGRDVGAQTFVYLS